MSAIVKLLQKLQLQYTTTKTTSSENDEANAQQQQQNIEADAPELLKPSFPKDFELFLNLVEFCKLILPKMHVNFFDKWVYMFGRELIIRSNQFALVSGFYKLLAVTFKLAEKINYFKGLESTQPVRYHNHVIFTLLTKLIN